MNSPKIETLTFQISSYPHTRHEHTEPTEFANALGRFRAADGMLTWWREEEFSDIEEAKTVVAFFLNDWEVHAAIQGTPGNTVSFRSCRAQAVGLARFVCVKIPLMGGKSCHCS